MNFYFRRPLISIIVNMYNMRREAKRTLYSLTAQYQQSTSDSDYEVIVVDNGSTEPLDPTWVKSLGEQFKYFYMDYGSPSPVRAINAAITHSRADVVLCCIDGARILTPNIVNLSLQAMKLAKKPFVYTMSLHIGPKIQNYLVDSGYRQDNEDKLLDSISWHQNGYQLFEISSLAASTPNGYFSNINESNAFCMYKKDYIALGGFDQRFKSRGGGLANLAFFSRVHEDKRIQPILLIGEATFHQIHGGVATNVPLSQHPWPAMEAEYQSIYGKPYTNAYYPPLLFGKLVPESIPFICRNKT